MPELSRRAALKAGLACVACAALPRVLRAAPPLEPTAALGRYVIHLAQHPELASVNGSKIFAVPGVMTDAAELVVTRQAGNTFSVLSAFCTHEGTQVNPYSAALQRIVCSNHGSQFRLDGTVALGPAVARLPRYTSTYDPALNAVLVEIPEFVGAEGADEAQALTLTLDGPHPATAEARFRYTLPRAGVARLLVYDPLGRRVATLAEGAQVAGTYAAFWRVEGAAPGVYVARLIADGQVRTRAFVVAR